MSQMDTTIDERKWLADLYSKLADAISVAHGCRDKDTLNRLLKKKEEVLSAIKRDFLGKDHARPLTEFIIQEKFISNN